MDDRKQEICGDGNVQVAGNLNVALPRATRAQPMHMVRVIRKLDELVDEQARRHYGNPSEVDEKLEFNGVVAYKPFILEYGTYGHAVEGAYKALNDNDPGIAQRVTRFIRSLYRSLDAQRPPLASDEILRSLINDLYERLGNVPDVPAEEVEPSCNMIVAHAFVNCTVLKGAS